MGWFSGTKTNAQLHNMADVLRNVNREGLLQLAQNICLMKAGLEMKGVWLTGAVNVNAKEAVINFTPMGFSDPEVVDFARKFWLAKLEGHSNKSVAMNVLNMTLNIHDSVEDEHSRALLKPIIEDIRSVVEQS